MKQNLKNRVLAAMLTIVALAVGHSSAWAETVTYSISGQTEQNGTVNLDIAVSGSVTGTVSDQWSSSTTSDRTINLPGDITFKFGSDKTSSLFLKSTALTIEATSSTGGYITLSHASKYIYHVTLKDRSNNVVHEAWNMTKRYTYNFQQIELKYIVVEYATAIPISDAVISGLSSSYPVSNAAVTPTPTVTWHGTTLTKDTHYTLSYQDISTAGTATVKATGKGIFSSSTNKSANYTLVWATYTVRFNANGGTGTMSNQAFTYNTAQNLTANAFTAPTGYHFDRWTTKADGSGTRYTDGQSVSNLTATNGATVDLYAQWAPNTYTVTLDNQGATTSGTTAVTATYDADMPAITVPDKTDYTFGGYYTAANGGGTKYYNADGTSAHTWDIASATTLYAKWSSVNVSYIDANGTEQRCSDFTIIQSDEQYLNNLTLGDSNNDEAWYVVIGRVEIVNYLKFQDKAVHLILCDNATLTIPNGPEAMQCSRVSLTIYGQSGGTGSIEANGKRSNSAYYGISAKDITINGGNVNATGYNGIASGNVTINGGNVNVSDATYGINASGDVIINGGNVSTGDDCSYGIKASGNVTINGGNVSASSEFCGIDTENRITLGWTNASDCIYASLYHKPPVVKSGQTFTDGTQTYSGSLTENDKDAIGGKTLKGVDVLYNSSNNNITDLDGKETNIYLKDRTLYKDGDWNTLCLPFNLTLSGSVLDGDNVDVRTLSSSSFKSTTGELTLTFTDKCAVTELQAGKPYIIKWSKNNPSDPNLTNLVNPTFTNVTISDATANVPTTYADFIGTTSPVVYDAGTAHQDVLFLGSGSTLYYPDGSKASTINAFRAYFQLLGSLTASPNPSEGGGTGVRAFVLNFGDGGETSSLNDKGEMINDKEAGAWYDLQGRRVNGQSSMVRSAEGRLLPTGRKNGQWKKGLYIHGNRKVVIK